MTNTLANVGNITNQIVTATLDSINKGNYSWVIICLLIFFVYPIQKLIFRFFDRKLEIKNVEKFKKDASENDKKLFEKTYADLKSHHFWGNQYVRLAKIKNIQIKHPAKEYYLKQYVTIRLEECYKMIELLFNAQLQDLTYEQYENIKNTRIDIDSVYNSLQNAYNKIERRSLEKHIPIFFIEKYVDDYHKNAININMLKLNRILSDNNSNFFKQISNMLYLSDIIMDFTVDDAIRMVGLNSTFEYCCEAAFQMSVDNLEIEDTLSLQKFEIFMKNKSKVMIDSGLAHTLISPSPINVIAPNISDVKNEKPS